jgi:hypothetical protein
MEISHDQDPEDKSSTPKDAAQRKSSNRADLLENAIQSIEKKLGAGDLKATFADFIRLLQLQKELQAGEPREIKVTWIDPSQTESASEE